RRLRQLLLVIRGDPPPEDDHTAGHFNFQISQRREPGLPQDTRGLLGQSLVCVNRSGTDRRLSCRMSGRIVHSKIAVRFKKCRVECRVEHDPKFRPSVNEEVFASPKPVELPWHVPRGPRRQAGPWIATGNKKTLAVPGTSGLS